MISKSDSGKTLVYLYFSDAIQFFYDARVLSIHNYDFWEDGTENAKYTNYHIDFMLDNDLPGYARLACVWNNCPIFEISILSENLTLHMTWFEFEIIRPYILTSMTDIVNRYRSLLLLYEKYNSGVIKYHSHLFYLEYLKKYLKIYQNSIEEIAVMVIDKKEQNRDGGVEGLIKIGLESRLPLIEKEENVNMNLIDKILLN